MIKKNRFKENILYWNNLKTMELIIDKPKSDFDSMIGIERVNFSDFQTKTLIDMV